MSNPPCQDVPRERQKMMKTEMQLELSLTQPVAGRGRVRRARRLSAAGWWFARMREAVDQAMEWGTPEPARPQQADLILGAGR